MKNVGLLVLMSLSLAACGGDSDDNTMLQEMPGQAQAGEQSSVEADAAELEGDINAGLDEAEVELDQAGNRIEREVDEAGIELNEAGDRIEAEADEAGVELNEAGDRIAAEADETGDDLESTGEELESDLNQAGEELESEAGEVEAELEQAGADAEGDLQQIGNDIEDEIATAGELETEVDETTATDADANPDEARSNAFLNTPGNYISQGGFDLIDAGTDGISVNTNVQLAVPFAVVGSEGEEAVLRSCDGEAPEQDSETQMVTDEISGDGTCEGGVESYSFPDDNTVVFNSTCPDGTSSSLTTRRIDRSIDTTGSLALESSVYGAAAATACGSITTGASAVSGFGQEEALDTRNVMVNGVTADGRDFELSINLSNITGPGQYAFASAETSAPSVEFGIVQPAGAGQIQGAGVPTSGTLSVQTLTQTRFVSDFEYTIGGEIVTGSVDVNLQ